MALYADDLTLYLSDVESSQSNFNKLLIQTELGQIWINQIVASL